MDTRYNKEEEDEQMNLDYKPSNKDPPNNVQLIDSDDKKGTSEKLLEEY